MAAPVVASSTTFADTSNQTTRTINKPTGLASGDWALLCVSIDATATINTPPGFTQIEAAATFDTSPHNQKFFQRLCDGSEGATFTITSSSEIASGYMLRITGADATACIDVLSEWVGSPDLQDGEVLAVCPGLYAAGADTLLLRSASIDDGTSTITDPAGHTAIANAGASASGTGGGRQQKELLARHEEFKELARIADDRSKSQDEPALAGLQY